MRALFFIFAMLTSGSLATARDFPPQPVLAFNLIATNQSFSQQLGSGLILRVERDDLGWEAGVCRRRSEDNLLYPQKNWHGAFPCQLSAWSQRSQTFADERVIPIRGRKSSVCIRLINAKVTGDPDQERFTAGRIEIFYPEAK